MSPAEAIVGAVLLTVSLILAAIVASPREQSLPVPHADTRGAR